MVFQRHISFSGASVHYKKNYVFGTDSDFQVYHNVEETFPKNVFTDGYITDTELENYKFDEVPNTYVRSGSGVKGLVMENKDLYFFHLAVVNMS